jgi:hypothetical protein
LRNEALSFVCGSGEEKLSGSGSNLSPLVKLKMGKVQKMKLFGAAPGSDYEIDAAPAPQNYLTAKCTSIGKYR